MGRFVLRRLVQAVFTVFGVMLVTFVLFRIVAGDVSASFANEKLGREARQRFYEKHKLDRPLLINYHRRLQIIDKTDGTTTLEVASPPPSRAADALGLNLSSDRATLPGRTPAPMLVGRYVFALDRNTKIEDMADEKGLLRAPPPGAPAAKPAKPTPGPQERPDTQPSESKTRPASRASRRNGRSGPTTQPATRPTTRPATRPATRQDGEAPVELPEPQRFGVMAPEVAEPSAGRPRPVLIVRLTDWTRVKVDLTNMATAGELIDAINNHPEVGKRMEARISEWSGNPFDSQFFWHLRQSVTFSGRSYGTEQTLTAVIARRAKYSLAITIPALAIGLIAAMAVSSLVAYFRDTWVDRVGVFLSVLGMCIPFLAYMIIGQAIMFRIDPDAAFGLSHTANIYVPVAIAVIAGLGLSVRFYRTVILDQVNQDYVRTAKAKGVPLPAILFKHVLKNCTLPILTNLIVSIPFLIMGSLLLERFFGIPGLGDLLVSSVSNSDVPIVTGLTYLTAVAYVLALLLTDILYAAFDPRIRLR